MKGRETGGEFRGTGRCVTGMVRCLRSKLSVRIQSPIGYHSNLNSKLLNTSGFCGCFFFISLINSQIIFLDSSKYLKPWSCQDNLPGDNKVGTIH